MVIISWLFRIINLYQKMNRQFFLVFYGEIFLDRKNKLIKFLKTVSKQVIFTEYVVIFEILTFGENWHITKSSYLV